MVFRQGGPSLKVSVRLVLILAAAVGLLAAVCAGAALWVSHEHNRLAERDARRMIAGGVAALEEKLRAVTVDYANWTEAFEAVRAREADWIWTNIGTGAAEVGTADLMIVIEPGAERQYGWVHGMDAEPSSSLLPERTIANMLRLLDDVPVTARRAASRYALVDGQAWLLAVARVRPLDALPAGITDTDMPRLLFGLRLDDEVVAEFAARFLDDELDIAAGRVPGRSSLPLIGPAGVPVAHLVWTAPTPGNAILRELAPGLAITLGLVVLVTVMAARHVVRSARDLDAAQAADRARSAFLANVSHELRTPMNGILGTGQLIKAMQPEPKVAKLLDVLLASARSQLEMIEDLLDIARIDSGAARLAAEPFDPVQTAREVCELLAPQAADKGLDLEIEAPQPLGPRALGDKGRFRQIVTNLVGNAIKFTEDGAVTVRLDVTEEKARLHVALSVADTGPGIDLEDHERIFERFFQGDAGPTPRASGTGLGLSITKSLVELMGGTLRLESVPGQGTAFHVALSLPQVSDARAVPSRRACGESCLAAE